MYLFVFVSKEKQNHKKIATTTRNKRMFVNNKWN